MVESLGTCAQALVATLAAGGTLFVCGNGESMADALAIASELKRSFGVPHPMRSELAASLAGTPEGAELANRLEGGVRAIALGTDPLLTSAAWSDMSGDLVFAQELGALARAGDALLLIKTSGHDQNLVNAAMVARALGMGVAVVAWDGVAAELASLTHVVVHGPQAQTVGEQHGQRGATYGALCQVIENSLFGPR
jgi:D-sedoheptulose 7-phosphate isomerase